MKKHHQHGMDFTILRLAALILLTATTSMIFGGPAVAQDAKSKIKAAFTDASWDGKTVPDKGICTLHGGKGKGPGIKFTNVVPGAKQIVLKFTDQDYDSEGFHGEISIAVPPGATTVTLPEFTGESDTLPPGVKEIASHGCSSCGSGVYLGPCSGGRGHSYYANIYVLDAKGKKIDGSYIDLGQY